MNQVIRYYRPRLGDKDLIESPLWIKVNHLNGDTELTDQVTTIVFRTRFTDHELPIMSLLFEQTYGDDTELLALTDDGSAATLKDIVVRCHYRLESLGLIAARVVGRGYLLLKRGMRS